MMTDLNLVVNGDDSKLDLMECCCTKELATVFENSEEELGGRALGHM